MLLTTVSALSIILPTITVFLTISLQTKTLKKLSVFVLITAVLEAIAYIYTEYGINNMFLFHIYSYIEVFGIAWIFWSFNQKWYRFIILTSTMFYLIFSLINISLWESLIQFNSNQRYVGGIVIIIFTLLYFVKLFIDAKIQKIEEDHFFWFSSFLLIYTAGTLFLFILGKAVRADDKYMNWDHIHSILNILLNIGFTLTLWIGTRNFKKH